MRAKATTITGYQCSLSYTKDTKVCGYNTNTNHYHYRQRFFQNTMLRYRAISRNDCQNHKNCLLDLPNKQFNRTVEPAIPIAVLAGSDQQESISKILGKIQAYAFDQDFYGVWVYSPQSKYKSWIPKASQKKFNKQNIIEVVVY